MVTRNNCWPNFLKQLFQKTNTPGAKDVSAHLFTLMMVDDCYGPDDQKKFVRGLNAFEDIAKKKFSKRFIECTPAQRNQLVAEIDGNKQAGEDVSAFYNITKRLTLQRLHRLAILLNKSSCI